MKNPEHTESAPRRDLLKYAIIGGLAALVAITAYASVEKNWHAPRSEFTVSPTWEQNFAQMPSGTPDDAIWRSETNPDVPGYNDEKQAYTPLPENVRIERGEGLVIQAHKKTYMYPNDSQARRFAYTSGRIDTQKSLAFEYGKIEATMKLPEGQGTWPAFWLLSANHVHTQKHDVTSANFAENERLYMLDGELDVVEAYGHTPGMIEGTVHTLKKSNQQSATVPHASTVFHVYGMELTPDKIVWTIDGRPYQTFEKSSDNPAEWPFSSGNKFYLIFNLAMGGSAGGEIDDTQHQKWRMVIKDVKYFPYIGD